MSYWDNVTNAAQEGRQMNDEYPDPDPLPPGLHWVRIARSNGFEKADGIPTVVINFVEVEPPPVPEGEEKPLPREHAHFEKFVDDPHRMKYVVKTLQALGASEKTLADAKLMHDFLLDSPEKCRKWQYQIEVTESTGNSGRIFLNATILREREAGSDPGVSQPATAAATAATTPAKSWDNWGSKKQQQPDDDVAF